MSEPQTDSQPIDILDPRSLKTWIDARMPAPAELTGLSLFCSGDLSNRILCLVSYRNALPGVVAKALEGHIFGFDSVVVSFPLPDRFRCARRKDGLNSGTQSCSCIPGSDGVPSLLDELN